MRIRIFNHVRFQGDWEINLIGHRLNLRIGRSQLGLWRDLRPVFSFVR